MDDPNTKKAWERAGRGAARLILVAGCVVASAAIPAAAQTSAGKPAVTRRAAPPRGTWDRVTADTFLPDAFSTLQGERPVFGAAPPTAAAVPAEDSSGGAFAWSTLVSEDTLTDEIKDTKAVLAAACDTPTDFKGGGFEKARVAFGSLALAFGVIAAYDRDVRWNKDAATARDLFARAGFNCKVGTDQSFAESQARLEDLEALLDGNSPVGKPERDEDFRWSQVAGRPPLMKRLEESQAVMRPAIASPAAFNGSLDELLHAVEMIALIGEVIRQPEFEYHDDDSYLAHAAAMRDGAVEARAALEKKDYEAARAAVGKIEKSCDACHGDYRS